MVVFRCRSARTKNETRMLYLGECMLCMCTLHVSEYILLRNKKQKKNE